MSSPTPTQTETELKYTKANTELKEAPYLCAGEAVKLYASEADACTKFVYFQRLKLLGDAEVYEREEQQYRKVMVYYYENALNVDDSVPERGIVLQVTTKTYNKSGYTVKVTIELQFLPVVYRF